MKLAVEIPYYKEALLRLLYPSTCGVCDALLELGEQGLCQTCSSKVSGLRFGPEKMLAAQTFELLEEAWSLYPYESPVSDILRAVKFSRKRWLVRAFRDDLKNAAETLAGNSYDLIVPIPMDGRKRLAREFNQAEVIAVLWGETTGLPVAARALRKPRSTPAQSRLGRKERQVNLYRAFEVPHPAVIAGRSILLVDDILTTGATAEEAARVLREQGAKKIGLPTLARSETGEGTV